MSGSPPLSPPRPPSPPAEEHYSDDSGLPGAQLYTVTYYLIGPNGRRTVESESDRWLTPKEVTIRRQAGQEVEPAAT